MPRVRWFAPLLLVPLLVASPAAAQIAPTIVVDDNTPIVTQTVNVSVDCPDGIVVRGSITRTPPDPVAATPPIFQALTFPYMFSVIFNVEGNFTISATCTNSAGQEASATLPLTVIDEQTPTTTTTTTIAPPTTAPSTTPPVTPTSGAVSPTSAASVTTDPGQLPATGTSDSAAFIAVVLLGLGAMVLLVTRKFRALDE